MTPGDAPGHCRYRVVCRAMEARGGMPRRVRDRALFPNKAPDHVIPLALAQSHQRGKSLQRPSRGGRTPNRRVAGNEISRFANLENPPLRISVSKCEVARHCHLSPIPRAHSDAPRPELALETRPIRIGTVLREFTEDRDRETRATDARAGPRARSEVGGAGSTSIAAPLSRPALPDRVS